MTLFWALAAIILVLASFLVVVPLLRGQSHLKSIAVGMVLVLPALSLLMYQQVGTPEAIGISGIPRNAAHSQPGNDAGDLRELTENLRARLDESPESLEGWMLLARTLKTMQRFPEALEALQTAQRIDPDNPYITVELIEAELFTSGNRTISAETVRRLQDALTIEPNLQKALWLLGVAAAQSGEDEAAISYWETLLDQVEPDSPIRDSIGQQIAEAQQRLGITPASPEPAAEVTPVSAPEPEAAAPGDSEAWTGVAVEIDGGAEMPASMAENATLFVIVQLPGVAAGPPIGVRRIRNPQLPLEITLTDRDSMLQERLISSSPQVQLQARLSLSGSPARQPGDWQSEPVVIPLDSSEEVVLILDQELE